MSVALGIDSLLGSGQLEGLNVGVVCNPASVNRELRHTVDRIWAEPRATLVAIFGPQHGFRSDAQDNMIETPTPSTHAMECPSSRSTATRESQPGRCSRDRRAGHRPPGRGHPRLHLHLYDGALSARRPHTRCPGRCLRPAKPDRRGDGRGPRPSDGVRIVRRPVPDPTPTRDDDRRAGAPVQRTVRDWRAADGESARGMDPDDVSRRSGDDAVGNALAQPPDLGQRARLPGCRSGGGDEPVGGTRDHSTVRADRSTLDPR